MSIPWRVCASAALPAKTRERRTKPQASSTSARVSSGQSLRRSLEWPWRAAGLTGASPYE
uniref:hypothetical protein n=1 Tax=Nitrococcus mobilis TaxID=35797 RepID=UPI0018DE344A|nr:hypothetical protein [Nitrococcus mobilis]